MEIKGYNDIDVKLLRATPNPDELIGLAANITMKQNFNTPHKNLEGVIKYMVDANHTAPLELIDYTYLVNGASRSFLAQITRHRMASYVSASQHYQNYSNYGFRIADQFKDNPVVRDAAEKTMEVYKSLIDAGIPQSEARQILPNGMENHLIVKMNARSLGNFFTLRLCNRNTTEIQTVAKKMYGLAYEHFQALWKNYGFPDCVNGSCKQGKMFCGKKYGEKDGQEKSK